jgi:hypothetical protein
VYVSVGPVTEPTFGVDVKTFPSPSRVKEKPSKLEDPSLAEVSIDVSIPLVYPYVVVTDDNVLGMGNGAGVEPVHGVPLVTPVETQYGLPAQS